MACWRNKHNGHNRLATHTRRNKHNTSYAFLFFRFNPDAYWYVLVVLVRNAIASVVPIIGGHATTSTEAFSQVAATSTANFGRK